MEALYGPTKSEFEEQLLKDLSPEVPWALVERFGTLVRESDSEGEREAAQYIAERLGEFGVPHQVYEPELFLSVPISASVEVEGQRLRAKPSSFSTSTGAEGVTGEVVYLPSAPPKSSTDVLSPTPAVQVDLRGKIAMTDGFGLPGPVQLFEEKGAVGQIHINRGENIHWGICTSTWGAPDLDSAGRRPNTPVIAISRPDGEALLKRAQQGGVKVTIRSELKEGWFVCPLIVAEIQGQEEPERFVLAHGHYDSWAVGVGDNAVGNATLLELARLFHKHRDGLARSLKVAWWPGHSTGRYAGSTWFADTFGLELARNCIAQVNIDSPGCRWATEYSNVSWMAEAEDFCVRAIRDATGQKASGERPPQAGDYSFNNIGLSSFFMLLSTMPRELREEKGYYAVGGSGGNIGWHTEEDTLEIADRDNLMRDLRVFVVSLQRVLNNPVHPFDFRKLGTEFRATLEEYAAGAGDELKFDAALAGVDRLQGELQRMYGGVDRLEGRPVADRGVRVVNDTILQLARILVPINYTRFGRFRTEPAVQIPPLPDLAPALEMKGTKGHQRRVLRTHLRRGLNRVTCAIERSADVVRRANEALSKVGAST